MRLDLLTTRTDRVLVDAFGPQAYVIGGPVRDKLRELFHGTPYAPKDKDYVVVGFTLDEVKARLEGAGRLDLVGASFGVIKLTVPGEATCDVALPRRDRSTGWSRKDVAVASGPMISLDEDQARRDFLMNAVAVRLSTGELVAHPGAVEDIRARRITAINGGESFREDPLRLLRAAQFAARLEFEIAPETLAHMGENAALMGTVAPERIAEELSKLFLRAARPSEGLRILHTTGLLPAVIPGLEHGHGVEQNRFHAFDVLGHGFATLDAAEPTLEGSWAAILHDIGKPATRAAHKAGDGYTFYNHEHVGAERAQQVLRDLRYPNAFIERVVRLVDQHMYLADPDLSDAALRRFIDRVGPELLEAQFALRRHDRIGCGLPRPDTAATNAAFEARVRAILAAQPPLRLKDLALDGRDVAQALVASGVKPPGFRQGPEIGRVLAALRARVIDEPALNTRDTLLAEAARLIAAGKL